MVMLLLRPLARTRQLLTGVRAAAPKRMSSTTPTYSERMDKTGCSWLTCSKCPGANWGFLDLDAGAVRRRPAVAPAQLRRSARSIYFEARPEG